MLRLRKNKRFVIIVLQNKQLCLNWKSLVLSAVQTSFILRIENICKLIDKRMIYC